MLPAPWSFIQANSAVSAPVALVYIFTPAPLPVVVVGEPTFANTTVASSTSNVAVFNVVVSPDTVKSPATVTSAPDKVIAVVPSLALISFPFTLTSPPTVKSPVVVIVSM